MVRAAHVVLAALTIWLAALAAARAEDQLPAFALDTSYVSVREALIRSGFQPVRVFRGSGDRSCKLRGTPCYPELLGCWKKMGSSSCGLLFERPADGLMIEVETFLQRRNGRWEAGFWSIGEASLYDLIIATSDGKGRQEICTPPDALASCSDAAGACARRGLPEGRRPPVTICEDVRRATEGLPRFLHTPNYRQVKTALRKIGLVPEAVATPQKYRAADCAFRGSNICAQSPEVMACDSGSSICDFLFRGSDGRAAIVELLTRDSSPEDFWLDSIRWPDESDRRLYGDIVLPRSRSSSRR